MVTVVTVLIGRRRMRWILTLSLCKVRTLGKCILTCVYDDAILACVYDDADIKYRAPNDARLIPNKPILLGGPVPTTAAQPQRAASGPLEDMEGFAATSSNSDPRPTCRFKVNGSCKFPAESCKAGKHGNGSTTDAPSGPMTNKAQEINNNLNELHTSLKKNDHLE
jgi:hypothetical protein